MIELVEITKAFPGVLANDRISLVVVRSRPGFVVTHTAPLEVTPAAKAAFWARADRIVASASR